jgi:hypothetical protein
MISTKGKTFTVQRSKWLRGEGEDASMLLRNDGKMCCLGQVCQQLGFSNEQMLTQENPSHLKSQIEGLTEACTYREGVTDSYHCREMMQVNDDTLSEDKDREQALCDLATEAGFSLQFID